MCAAVLAFLRFVYKCPMKLFLGIPCPGCGMTRAVWHFVLLDFPLSFAYNPLAVFVIIGGVYYLFIRRWKRLAEVWEKVYLWGFCAALIIIWLVRLFITGWSVTI